MTLEFNNVSFSYGAGFSLHDLSFCLQPGECVGLIGPNGAGKSTILKMLAGIIKPSGGDIVLDDMKPEDLGPRVIAQKTAYLPQQRRFHWDISVRSLIELGRLPYRRRFGGLLPDDHRAVERAIELMDLKAHANRPVSNLSGGEQARVHVARALAQDAKFILADEPTAGLDPAHQISLMRCFAEHAKTGGSVLVSLHDLGMAARWCDRILLLDNGRIVMEGAPDMVMTRDNLARVYGIRAHVSRTEDGLVIATAGLSNDA